MVFLVNRYIIVFLLLFSGCAVIGPGSVNLGKWYGKHVPQTEEQVMNPCITFHTFNF